MDALDAVITASEEAARAGGGPEAVRHLVAASDLLAVAQAVSARPRPWFFASSPALTVFATASACGSGSAIHDHGLWAVIGCLAGQEGSRRYEEQEGRLVETGVGMIRAGEVHALAPQAIHAVFNCWDEPNLVLHLYGGDFLATAKRVWDPVTKECFDLGLVEPLVPARFGVPR